MRISLVGWFLIDFNIILNWDKCHDLRDLFILYGTSSDLHHACSLRTFEGRRSTTLAMVLVKLFLHTTRYTMSMRLSCWVNVWFNKWIISYGTCIVGVSGPWNIWTFTIACRSYHAAFLDSSLTDITQDVAWGRIVVIRRVNIALALYRVIVIEVYWRHKIDTVCIVVISRCNWGHQRQDFLSMRLFIGKVILSQTHPCLRGWFTYEIW